MSLVKSVTVVRSTARALAIVGLSLAAGCVALTSELRDEGTVYYLPKSILTISVREHYDTMAGRKWYLIGGEGKQYDKEADRSEAYIVDEAVPDLKFRYTLKYRPNALSDDRLCITRRPDGLLNDVIFASDDRTPEIAFNIARAIQAAMPAPKAAGYTLQTPSTVEKPVQIRTFTAQVDPFDDASIAAFNNALARAFGFRANVRINFDRMHEQMADGNAAPAGACKVPAPNACPSKQVAKRCPPDQICYRTKLKLPIDLHQNGQVIDMNYAHVINAWDIGTVNVSRAALVHKITKLRFQDGALIAAVVRKPSEVEEASLLPLNVVNAVLSVPAGAVASAFGAANTTTQTEQVAKLTQAVADLKKQQDALYATVSPAASSPITGELPQTIDCLDGKGQRAIPLNLIK